METPKCGNYSGTIPNRVRSKLLPTVYDLLDQPEREAIPIRFHAMMKSSFGIDPLECILCKSRMVLTGIVPGKSMAKLRQCHACKAGPEQADCFGVTG